MTLHTNSDPATDPVCGMTVDPARMPPPQSRDYDGKRYYFCCTRCAEKFIADPTKFLNEGPIAPPSQNVQHTTGYRVEECRAILTPYEGRNRASADVKLIAGTHLELIKLKIEELQSMLKTLGHLIHCCDGDDRPDCPILNDLAGLPVNQNKSTA